MLNKTKVRKYIKRIGAAGCECGRVMNKESLTHKDALPIVKEGIKHVGSKRHAKKILMVECPKCRHERLG